MLKTVRKDKTWLVTQPDHGELAGFFAAHWGNEEFARPGCFDRDGDRDGDPELRAETIFGIAQHDNGWWEWEADPEVAEDDGLPLGLSEVLQDQQNAMNRWRLGIPRFRVKHPYASLLISFHAYWLYPHVAGVETGPEFRHPLFWKRSPRQLMGEDLDAARRFVEEVEALQDELKASLRKDTARAAWVEPAHLHPHVRLLQLLDGLSLGVCSAMIPPRDGEARGLGEDDFDLLDVPRKSWEDRVTIEVRSVGDRRIALSPYPFDVDPLPVSVPARIVGPRPAAPGPFPSWWHSEPEQLVPFEYCSK